MVDYFVKLRRGHTFIYIKHMMGTPELKIILEFR